MTSMQQTEQTAADLGAADLVERFAEAWSKMDPDAFTPLFHRDVHLIHPIERDTHGIDHARAFMERTMSLVPDLRYDVEGWARGSGHVIIWGRLYGTLGGGPIEWPLVDRIKMADGTAFPIPHPDFLAYNPAGRTCVVLTETDELHILDLLLMTELEVPQSESASR